MEKLTLEQAAAKVKEIEGLKEDSERAHRIEDTLRDNFLIFLAGGHYTETEAVEIANIVLQTSDIDFARWYA